MIKLAIALVLLPGVAMAADDPSPMTQIVSYFATFLATLLTGLIAWALQKYFGITITQNAKGTLETAMQNGIALAVSKYTPNGMGTMEQKNTVVGAATDYVLAHVPDAAKTLGIASPAALAEKIEARLVQQPVAAGISPATAQAPSLLVN